MWISVMVELKLSYFVGSKIIAVISIYITYVIIIIIIIYCNSIFTRWQWSLH